MPPKKKNISKVRLDQLLAERGLVESPERAKAHIMAGQVFVAGERVDKPGTRVAKDAAVDLRFRNSPYASRGGLKLAGALKAFEFDPAGLVALDIGASTGGFTDYLLQHGAARVYAVDVGYGQLAWKLRQDPRVINLERTNIRKLPDGAIPELIALVVVDCSFISLTKVLPPALSLLAPGACIFALIKPQFEVGRGKLEKGGVVRDEALRQEAIADVVVCCEKMGLSLVQQVDSEVHGPKGNIEHFVWLKKAT